MSGLPGATNILNELYLYIWTVATHWVTYMVAGPLVIYEFVKWVSPAARRWLDSNIRPSHRRRIEVVLMVFGVFYAGFLAFDEEHTARLAAEARLMSAPPPSGASSPLTTPLTAAQDRAPPALNEGAPTPIPSVQDLMKLSNDDLRSLTYAAYEQLDELVTNNYYADDNIDRQDGLTPAQKGE